MTITIYYTVIEDKGMRKKIEWHWETLDQNTSRAKVIGGWLVHVFMEDRNRKFSTSSVAFVADRDHEWYISAPVSEVIPITKNLAKDFECKS